MPGGGDGELGGEMGTPASEAHQGPSIRGELRGHFTSAVIAGAAVGRLAVTAGGHGESMQPAETAGVADSRGGKAPGGAGADPLVEPTVVWQDGAHHTRRESVHVPAAERPVAQEAAVVDDGYSLSERLRKHCLVRGGDSIEMAYVELPARSYAEGFQRYGARCREPGFLAPCT